MTLQALLDDRQITKYYLSQISGVPKTTLMDICAGRSSIQRCSAGTVFKLAKALNCSMEEIMCLDENADSQYDADTGLPKDKSYLECSLPASLMESIDKMEKSWTVLDSGGTDYRWDIYWSELNADINFAEVEQAISTEQAWYLREKYLRMKRKDD